VIAVVFVPSGYGRQLRQKRIQKSTRTNKKISKKLPNSVTDSVIVSVIYRFDNRYKPIYIESVSVTGIKPVLNTPGCCLVGACVGLRRLCFCCCRRGRQQKNTHLSRHAWPQDPNLHFKTFRDMLPKCSQLMAPLSAAMSGALSRSPTTRHERRGVELAGEHPGGRVTTYSL
jgi:hypothetical protein